MQNKKPYRVYRQSRRVRGDGAIPWGEVGDDARPSGPKGARAPRRILRFFRRVVFVALALGIVWAVIAFLSFRSAVNDRNDELPDSVRNALAPVDGPAIATSQVTLLVGADTSAHRQTSSGEKAKDARADTLILMRTDPPSRTVSMLSIPRDLWVTIPGTAAGEGRINEAYAIGGLEMSIKTVRKLTGIDVNHVVQIDLDGFKEIVDELGGITIDNPSLLQASQPFDGKLWRFRRGEITLNGRQALAYARMRHTTDFKQSDDRARGLRQQRVIDAIVQDIVSPSSLKDPRGVPRAVVAPLLTDISASQMLSFGFGKWWSKSDNNLRCRLGGDAQVLDSQDVLIPSEENRATVRMFMGRQQAVKPATEFGPGCITRQ
jgi:LCP family protein required for cell wall assembly